MQIAAIYDGGIKGQEFIKSLGGSVGFSDDGCIVWVFEETEEAKKHLAKLFSEVGKLVLVVIVGHDDEDLIQYLPL